MVDYKDTLNLPQTPFEMRAGLAKKEPVMLRGWEEQDLYGQLRRAQAGRPRFVLHDGPPYANGALHHGHILNKLLKDMVVKDRSMAGFDVPFIPGWDCHGLPIEVQVDKQLGARKKEMDQAAFRGACRSYAERFVALQRDAFKRLGVLGRWHDPYLTMAYGYEAATLREFARLLDTGLVYKGLRPINWCLVHQTALAEAEVEYETHQSPSVYVAFELVGELPAGLQGPVDVVIWTTTPWTLPANRAIAVHADFTYVCYPVDGRQRLVEETLLPAFLAAVGAPPFDPSRIGARLRGAQLQGATYQHCFLPRRSPILCAAHVTRETGTGCVHTAPAHGADDFALGRAHNLDLSSPVDAYGVLSADAGPFAGLKIMAANKRIPAALAEQGRLLGAADASLAHRYPHCWRCHKPIIIRATEQWFVALDKPFGGGASLRDRALASLDGLHWVPPWGQARLAGMLRNRPDWCLSRQRQWGVPLAVGYCAGCQTPLARGDLVHKVADVVAREGADAWFRRPLAELWGTPACAQCGATAMRKECDILDVWFDSGASYAAVLEAEGLGVADLVLEGSDQHRGWFHSALLMALATRQRPPYKAVLTHGFVVDGRGKKLSKSLGNFADPEQTIAKDGAELLRLWVAGEDYRDDVRLSQEIAARLADTYRKIRNTLRYVLGNLHDFNFAEHGVATQALDDLDRLALALLAQSSRKARSAFAEQAFHTGMQCLIEFCTVDMSAFYLDIIKDRLYAEAPNSRARRSAQTVLYVIARDLLAQLAPVLCFTCEEAWTHLPKLDGDPASVHLLLYPDVAQGAGAALPRLDATAAAEQSARYAPLRPIRRAVNTALEQARRDKVVGASVQAHVRLRLPPSVAAALRPFAPEALATFFIVSTVEMAQDAADDQVGVEVSMATGQKCARCWLYRADVGRSAVHPQVCGRCVRALPDAA